MTSFIRNIIERFRDAATFQHFSVFGKLFHIIIASRFAPSDDIAASTDGKLLYANIYQDEKSLIDMRNDNQLVALQWIEDDSFCMRLKIIQAPPPLGMKTVLGVLQSRRS